MCVTGVYVCVRRVCVCDWCESVCVRLCVCVCVCSVKLVKVFFF